MIELGEVPCLNVLLAGVDPAVGKAKGLAENVYNFPEPIPERMTQLRQDNKLTGDIILYNGDGDFLLKTWQQYKEEPELFPGKFTCRALKLRR